MVAKAEHYISKDGAAKWRCPSFHRWARFAIGGSLSDRELQSGSDES